MIDELLRYLGSWRNRELVLDLLAEHVRLSLLPLLFGVLVALPLGWAAHRYRPLRGLFFGSANLLYTVPSLALFVILPGILGTKILDEANVVVALTLYTAALLVRPVTEALDALPGHVLAAATAMGYRPARRFLAVELPLAVPVLSAGVRVASVSNISLVSVGALIGVGGLGQLFTAGFQNSYNAPIVVGIVLTLALALIVDLLLVGIRTAATPWLRAERAHSARSADAQKPSARAVP
ncbi:MAG: ABC transporter permease [Pseudonocardiaceae bacterium]